MPTPLSEKLLHPLEWRLVPPVDTYPRAIAFAQTYGGKLVLLAVFAALMKLVSPGLWIEHAGLWWLLPLAAMVVALAGRHRHIVLLICTGLLLVRVPDWYDFHVVSLTIQMEGLFGAIDPSRLRAAILLACVPVAALAMYLARRYRDHPLGRRPILVQHILYLCLLGLAVSHLLRGLPQVVLWAVLTTFTAYFWFLAYALIDQRHRQPVSILFQFATFRPFTWMTMVPMGKGSASWATVEAATAEELAVTQLKALKLLAWACILKLVLWVLQTAVYEKIGVPPIKVAFETFVQSRNAPPLSIFSVLANFPEQLLGVAIWGHIVIAIGRLAGFRLLRNTWRPLSSRTIAEFWNRYFYYFKEVLVHVYFYPTYVRWFKGHPRLRLAFATFVAAGLGNFFFHLIQENRTTIVLYGLVDALVRAQTYAFYCLLLVTGIVISQLRARRTDPNAGWLRGQFVPSLGVVAFFCFLSFFDGPVRHVRLTSHFQFLFHILGIERWIKMIV